MKYVYGLVVLVVCISAFVLYNKERTLDSESASEKENSAASEEANTTEPGLDVVTEKPSQNTDQTTITLDPNARVIKVVGKNYAFDVKEIKVKKGETVTINFESTDGFHDWVLDEFDARTEKVSPGKQTAVTFVADTAGTFEYYCSIGSHRSHGMVGKFIVEE